MEGYCYTNNEDTFGKSKSKYHIEKMVQWYIKGPKRTSQLQHIQDFICNYLVKEALSYEESKTFDCAEEIKKYRSKLLNNTVVNFDLWINRNEDYGFFNDIKDIVKMMGAKIDGSECKSTECQYLYPCEFLDINTSHLFKTKTEHVKSKMKIFPNIKIVKFEYITDTYLNLKPIDTSQYEYKFPSSPC